MLHRSTFLTISIFTFVVCISFNIVYLFAEDAQFVEKSKNVITFSDEVKEAISEINVNDIASYCKLENLLPSIDRYCSEHSINRIDFFKQICTEEQLRNKNLIAIVYSKLISDVKSLAPNIESSTENLDKLRTLIPYINEYCTLSGITQNDFYNEVFSYEQLNNPTLIQVLNEFSGNDMIIIVPSTETIRKKLSRLEGYLYIANSDISYEQKEKYLDKISLELQQINKKELPLELKKEIKQYEERIKAIREKMQQKHNFQQIPQLIQAIIILITIAVAFIYGIYSMIHHTFVKIKK